MIETHYMNSHLSTTFVCGFVIYILYFAYESHTRTKKNTIYKYSDVMYSLCKHCDSEIEAGQYYHADCAKLLREEEELHKMLIKQARSGCMPSDMFMSMAARCWQRAIFCSLTLPPS